MWGRKNACRVLVEKTEEQKQLRRSGHVMLNGFLKE
jgi:hypothetical protein